MDLDHCLNCGKELPTIMKCLAHYRMEPKCCDAYCRSEYEFKKHRCCDKAVTFFCVCIMAFECPVHGTKHIGSHD